MIIPTTAPPVLAEAVRALEATGEGRGTKAWDLINDGSATAEDLAFVFALAGSPVSASTIRTYRRSLRREHDHV